jgi:hypothetical protein
VTKKKPTRTERLAEANGQSRNVEIRSGGPRTIVAHYRATHLRSKDHANNIAKALRSKGWRAIVTSQPEVTATVEVDD